NPRRVVVVDEVGPGFVFVDDDGTGYGYYPGTPDATKGNLSFLKLTDYLLREPPQAESAKGVFPFGNGWTVTVADDRLEFLHRMYKHRLTIPRAAGDFTFDGRTLLPAPRQEPGAEKVEPPSADL